MGCSGIFLTGALELPPPPEFEGGDGRDGGADEAPVLDGGDATDRELPPEL
jgi:hypothetical protein